MVQDEPERVKVEDLIKRLRKSAGTFPGRKWYGGPHPPPDVSAALLREAADALSVSEKRADDAERGYETLQQNLHIAAAQRDAALEERDSSQASRGWWRKYSPPHRHASKSAQSRPV